MCAEDDLYSLQRGPILTRPEAAAEVRAGPAEVVLGVGRRPPALVSLPGRIERAAVGARAGVEAADAGRRVADQAAFQEVGGQGGQHDDQIERGARQEL